MKQVYRLIIRRAKGILAAVVLLTAFFAYHAQHIRIDSSIESLLPQDDPEKQYYDEVRQLFGSDEVAMIGLIADNVYAPQTLQKIKRLTEAIRQLPEVKSVLSLTNAKDLIATVAEEDTLLIPEIPATAAAVEEIKQKLTQMPLYLKNLVSADGRAAAITITFLDSITPDEFIRRGVDDEIQAIVDRENGPEQLYYTGLPHFKAYAAKAMRQDLIKLLPLTLLLIIGVLFLSFRSWRGVLLPTLTVVVSLLWTVGIMVLAGSRLSVGTIALPPLVLVVGVAYSVHVVAEYYELARPGRPVNEVVLETVRAVNIPVFIAALTTVLGFLSLLVNRIVSIREMGLYSSVGITLAFVFSTVLVPASLALLPLPSRRADLHSSPLSSALQGLIRGIMRRRGSVLVACFVLSALSVWPIPSIRVGSNFLSLFRESHPIRQATDIMSRHLVGNTIFWVVIDGKEPDIMRKWDTLRRLKDLQLYIDALPGVDKTLSFVDYCEVLEKGLQEIPPEGQTALVPQPEQKPTFWDNPAQLDDVMQLASLYASNTTNVVNPTYSRANIIVRTSLSSPSEIAATVEQIQRFAQAHFPPELRVHPTGNVILNTRTTSGLITGQIESFTLTALIIFVIMASMFLSIRVGCIAMLPNLFPILVFFGLMGVSGAVLSLSTNTIASIMLGIAVDDTVHLMTRLSSAVRTTSDQEQALLQTYATVGKPAVYTSVVLFLGFLSLCLSTFVPIQEFGFLSAITIVVALAGDIVLLPALLATIHFITLWDLLYLKLGRAPHKAIRLFEGLRPVQAKIVTLMGELKTFSHGQPIIRQGEMGTEMYVLINGTADVRINSNGQPEAVRTLGRGDVFGEMGLIRHHQRTADVIATEDVEVLVVNERFLSRIQRHYPRISSKIFFNISKILSDRLETSQRVETWKSVPASPPY
jgi:predicted RND superfamily exporter protein